MSVYLLSLKTLIFLFELFSSYLQSIYTTGRENKMEAQQKTEGAVPS